MVIKRSNWMIRILILTVLLFLLFSAVLPPPFLRKAGVMQSAIIKLCPNKTNGKLIGHFYST